MAPRLKELSGIFLDVSRLLSRFANGRFATGIDRVGLEYVRHYGALPGSRAVISERGFLAMLSLRDSARAFELLLEQDFTRSWDARALMLRAILSAAKSQSAGPGVLLHTSHSGLEFNRYFQLLKKRDIRTVFMLHDLIPMTHPEYCRPGVLDMHRRRMHVALSHASGVITNSQVTLDSLVEHSRREGWGMPSATVAHLAPGMSAQVVGKRPIEAPYFVMLGTIEPRKNHWFVLHLWRRLVELYGNLAPTLVVIGRRGWECENVIDMLERSAPLRGKVLEESHCSDARLADYLHHAQALLFPSFVEGYGMPLAEALAMNVPVIASDLPVFREIAVDIPDYLDPLDGPGWMSVVLEYANAASVKRQSQLDRMQRFSGPTWSQHFRVVDKFLEALA